MYIIYLYRMYVLEYLFVPSDITDYIKINMIILKI